MAFLSRKHELYYLYDFSGYCFVTLFYFTQFGLTLPLTSLYYFQAFVINHVFFAEHTCRKTWATRRRRQSHYIKVKQGAQIREQIFYNMNIQFWAVGCGLWTGLDCEIKGLRRLWATFEGFFLNFNWGQKKIENIAVTALKSCIEKKPAQIAFSVL